MSYLPNVPGVPAPMSYGQGFGNWQKYAGYTDKNPFGSLPAMVPPSQPTAIAPIPQTQPIEMQPTIPNGQFGSQPYQSMGSATQGQYGSLEEAVKAEEHNY